MDVVAHGAHRYVKHLGGVGVAPPKHVHEDDAGPLRVLEPPQGAGQGNVYRCRRVDPIVDREPSGQAPTHALAPGVLRHAVQVPDRIRHGSHSGPVLPGVTERHSCQLASLVHAVPSHQGTAQAFAVRGDELVERHRDDRLQMAKRLHTLQGRSPSDSFQTGRPSATPPLSTDTSSESPRIAPLDSS